MMVMEKRWCKRIPATINIEIYYKGSHLSNCKTKNISLTGICIRSGPLAFHAGVTVQIKFPATSYLDGSIDTITACVVRNNSREIGLMFCPVEPELVQSVIKIHKVEIEQQSLAMV